MTHQAYPRSVIFMQSEGAYTASISDE